VSCEEEVRVGRRAKTWVAGLMQNADQGRNITLISMRHKVNLILPEVLIERQISA
jgi:hypothetical protein